MAPLLSRLFSSRRNSVRCDLDAENEFTSDDKLWKSSEFSSDQIRVLLFRECDWRGRKLLFDSKSVKVRNPHTLSPQASPSKKYMRILSRSSSSQEVKSNSLPAPKFSRDSYVEVSSNGTSYEYLRPPSDAKMLGEMIFGSVAMSYKGSTMKIHTIKSPMQLMLSEAFPAPAKSSTHEESNLNDSCNLPNSKETCPRPFTLSESWESSSVAHSIPVDVPEMAKGGLWRKDDSGFPNSGGDLSESYDSLSSHANFASSPDGYSSSNSSLTQSGSFSSLQRRWLRNRATSFEYGMKRAPDQEDNGLRQQRRIKLGIAVVITLPEENKVNDKNFHDFFFSHISIIERHFKVMKSTFLKTYSCKKDFVHHMMQALISFRAIINDLYQAPRLQSPVWLSLMSQGLQNQSLCQKFIIEFAELIQEFDTKNTNFFISSLLTAVLTHHLSWVPTIIPPGVPNSRSYHQKHSAKWLDNLAKSHPYNPLWVQLEDLYGLLGFPKRVSRTVISGKKKDLVLKFLFVLTYFIRCSELKESIEEMNPIDSTNEEFTSMISPCDKFSNISEMDNLWLDDSNKSSPLNFNADAKSSVDSLFIDQRHAKFTDDKSVSDQKELSWCKDNSSGDSSNRYRIKASELGLRLSIDTPTNSIPMHSNSFEANNCDDVFLCRTPDLDSGISEDSAEDAAVRASIINPDHSALPSSKMNDILPGTSESDSTYTEKNIDRILEMEDSKESYNLQQSDSNITLCSKNSNDNSSLPSSIKKDCSDSNILINENSDSIESVKPSVKVIIDSAEITEMKVNDSESDGNDESMQTITQTSQLLKEYLSVRFAFNHNLSALDKNLDENASQDNEGHEMKITDAKNKFYVRSESLIRQNEEHLETCDNDCECNKCKDNSSQFNYPLDLKKCNMDEMMLTNLAEMNFPQSKHCESKSLNHCFGRSLYASYSDHYMPDFCLQGVSQKISEGIISRDLHSYIQHNNHDLINEAVCIIADTDTWTVHIESSSGSCKETKTSIMTSQLISNMTESLLQLSKLKMSPDFCLMHLEDRLQELYFKSLLLTEHVRENKMISVSKLSCSLGLDPSDIPLLMSIASTHSPYIIAAMPYS